MNDQQGYKPSYLAMLDSAITTKVPSLLTATPLGNRSPCIKTVASLLEGLYFRNLPVLSSSSLVRKNCLH
jgi:hypothetical protein